MFEKLKHKNPRRSVFKNRPNARSNSKSPGATTSQTKGNEADRLVRCQHCGFICDRERNVRMKPGTWAGLGNSYGAQQTDSANAGDARIPAAGTVTPTQDKYYNKTVAGGCPNCGSYTYDKDYK